MKDGPLAAMDAIERATGEMKVHTMGYCVGGHPARLDAGMALRKSVACA